jgi:hypothetical protein
MTVQVEPTLGGNVSINGTMATEYPSIHTFKKNENVNIEAIPALDFSFSHWIVTVKQEETEVYENPTTITMDCTKYIVARFALDSPIPTYNLTAHTSWGGKITVNGSTHSSNPHIYSFIENTYIELEAVPDPSYNFANWSGDVTGNTNPISIIMDSDKTIKASFSPILFKVIVNVSPQGAGNVSLSPNQPADGYLKDAPIQLTAIANEGYEFVDWSGSVIGINKKTTINVTSNKSITANFNTIASSSSNWWAWIVIGVGIVGLLVFLVIIRRIWSK